MLKAAFVRFTRRPTPSLVQCARRKSVTAKSRKAKSSDVQNSVSVPHSYSRKQQDALILEGLTDPSEAHAEHMTPEIANTRKEMFGNSKRFNHHELGLKYDPTQLPIKRKLNPWEEAFTEEEYAMTLVHGRGVHEPFIHPRTHDIPVASIHFRSYHVERLNFFTHFVLHAASSLGIPTSGVASLPTKRTLWTVLRSPFAHKKSQENFERKVHKRAIKAWDADAEVVQRWIAYLRTHALAGVGMKVTTWDRVPLGIGNAKILYSDEDNANPSLTAPKKIKQLGAQITREEEATVVAKAKST